MPRFDVSRPFDEQAIALLDEVGLTAAEWQQEQLLLITPALNFAAAAVLAELHGRCGYFVPIVRLRPVEGGLPLRFEVAEIINLQTIRDKARNRRE